MTSAQRYWLSGFLLVFALGLAIYHLEWKDAYDLSSSDRANRLVLPWNSRWEPVKVYEDSAGTLHQMPTTFSQEEIAKILKIIPPPAGFQIDALREKERLVETGLYVRENRSGGVFLGLFVPSLLTGIAGFIALGKRKAAAQ